MTNSKCLLFLKLIQKYKPDLDVEFKPNTGNEFDKFIFPTLQSEINILSNSTWIDVKARIDNFFKKEKICTICDDTVDKSVACCKCGSIHCTDCYIDLFEKGEGVIECPTCKSKFGRKIPKNLIDASIEAIKEKIENL